MTGHSRAPCVAFDATAQHCVVALLLGARCCPDSTCALCRTTRDRMVSRGFAPDRAARMMARTRRDLLDRCPTCGFPPPPALVAIPPLPRLDRSEKVLSGSPECRVCGRALKPPQRFYCGPECWGQGGDRRSEIHVRVARFGTA